MKRISGVFILMIIVAAAAGNVFAQGEAAAEFLQIAPGARSGGMGETGVAVANDAYATYWNPAGLANMRGQSFSVMHANWLPEFNLGDLYYDYASYVHHHSGWGTFGISATYLNLGEQQGMDENANETGTFNSYNLAVGVTYGTNLKPDLSVGLTMKYIHLKLADTGTGAEKGKGTGSSVALDLGVLYKIGFIDRLTFGANLSNMGPKITFIDASQADPIPTNLKFGLAYEVLSSDYNKLTVTVEGNKLLVKKHEGEDGGSDSWYKAVFSSWSDDQLMKRMNGSIGAEYWYANLISLRAGYFYEDIGKRRFATFGAGLRYSIYGFDFGYINASEKGHPLSDTMRFSLSFEFGNR